MLFWKQFLHSDLIKNNLWLSVPTLDQSIHSYYVVHIGYTPMNAMNVNLLHANKTIYIPSSSNKIMYENKMHIIMYTF